MKRRILSLAALLLIVLSVTAQAAETRMGGNPVLAFDGTTAQCTATCYGRRSSDKVTATLTLYRGDTYVDSWSKTGTYRVHVSGETEVQRGKTYTLELTWTVNGDEQPPVSVSKRCS
ncbi:hypothetical protein [Dysosmobacter welbionis]